MQSFASAQHCHKILRMSMSVLCSNVLLQQPGYLKVLALPVNAFKNTVLGLVLLHYVISVCSWCSGRTLSLRPTEVVYILSGGGYKAKDVAAISAAADAACEDSKLMELAWEVREPYQAVEAYTT